MCIVFDCGVVCQMESRLGQIKDPIQRAGVRLLWAAAIPIQTQLRRFMARQAAIRRMCAVLTIQAVSQIPSNLITLRLTQCAHSIFVLLISLSAVGSPSAILKSQYGQPSKFKRHSEVGSLVIRWKIITIVQHRFREWREAILPPCMSLRICTV